MAPYRTMADYMATILKGRVQKIAINAGLSCPNRDGRLSRDGCAYCNNASFNPEYALLSKDSITSQLDKGVEFIRRKGAADAYLPYFQSFSNTYGETSRLIELYEEALRYQGVAGLVIATRPDCLAEDLLDYFESRFGEAAPERHPFLLMELGVESTNNDTLARINRGHTFECASEAITELDRRGIAVGAHLIIGLPGEKDEDFISHAKRISALPVSTLKLHQLQIIKGTPMAQEYLCNPQEFDLLTPERYADIVVRMLAELRKDIAVDRFVSESPSAMVLAPRWGIKPAQFQQMVEKELSGHSLL